MPGADDTTPLLAVTRGPATLDGVQVLNAEDLLSAWR
jgi:hypothetical protein